MNQSTSSTHLHFDLSFVPANVPAQLHVGSKRMPLIKHTSDSLQRHRVLNTALRLIPDECVTHYVEDVLLPTHVVQLLLVTTPATTPEATLDTLLLSMVHIPRTSREKTLQRRLAETHRHCERPHPKLAMYGVEATATSDPAPIIDVHDFKTAMDAAISIIFHHVELVNIGGDTAATVSSLIEYANGVSDLAMQILQQAQANQQNPNSQNWAFETPYLDTNLKPTTTMFYNWSDTTKEWMTGPLLDSIKQAKNDSSLQSTATNAGVYTVQQGTTVVNTPQSSAQERAKLVSDDSDYWTVNDLTPHHGFEQSGSLSFSNGQFSLSFLNNWLRWLSGYVEFYGPDGNPVKPANWQSMVPGGLAGVYDTDTQKYVTIFSSVNTILAIPVGNTPTAYAFPWPSNASSVRLLAGGIGRTGGVQGQDGTYIGSWQGHVCTPGAIMTGIFNFSLPTICMVAGAAVSLGPLNKLAQNIIPFILDIASAIVSGPVSSAIQGGNTTTVMVAFADLIPKLLIDCVQLAAWLSAEIAEGAAEEATPVVGWIALAISVASDVALLVETSVEVACSPATFEIVASRAIDAQWTISPDVNHQNTWPLEATHYEVLATYKDGTSRSTTGTLDASPQTGPITVYFNKQNQNRLPAGGDVQFTAKFFSSTGWLAGAATTAFISADVVGNLLTVPQMAITENQVPLTASTVYQFDQKLVYDAGTNAHAWSKAGGAPTATVKDLSSSNLGNNLAQLVNITVGQATSELGYTWQASGQNIPLEGSGPGTNSGQMFTFQGIDVRTNPDDALQFVPAGFPAKPLLLFARNGTPGSTGSNFYVDPRNGLYHLRQVILNGSTSPFDLATGQSWGRFNEQIDAAVVHPAGFVVGVNTANSKLEVLKLGATSVADADAPFANLFAGYGTRPGLLHIPVGIAATPNTGVVVLEAADSNLTGAEARLQSLDLLGNPAPIFAGGTTSIAPLKAESVPVTLLDVAVESKGFIYVLKYLGDGSSVNDYRLDLYSPDGSWLSQTAGISSAKMDVDLWRTLYTLNFETMTKPGGGRTEPSVSIWLPSTPSVA